MARGEKEERKGRDRSRERHRDRSRERSRDRRRRSRSRDKSDRRDRGERRRERTPERRVSQHELSPAPREPQQTLPPPPELPPPVHSIHKGTVHTIRPFGLFISIPSCRRHVLVHHSQISDEIRFAKDDVDEDKVKAMEFFLPKGQEVWVKLTEVSADEAKGGFRINGMLRTVNQETGQDLDPLNKKVLAAAGGGLQSDEPPEEGTVHTGVVKRIEPYGVFVQLQGYRKYGLVHSSQVSSYISFTKEDSDESKKAELEGVVSIGDVVHVKVVEVIPDDGSGRGPKIQCSMKLVDQTSGEDLDPTGVRYKPRGADGGGQGGGPVAPLGANAGTVKSGGKIDWGHLAGNDKLVASAQAGKYQMLDDEGEAGTSGKELPPAGALPPPPPQFRSVEEALAILEQGSAMKKASEKAAKGEKKKKHKDKDKKKKKGGKDKKEKKGKKEKKKKRRASSSDSSSDSD